MTPKKEDVLEKVRQWIEIAEEDISLAKHAFTLSSNIMVKYLPRNRHVQIF